MPTEVILPKVDMDMATGIIAGWHVDDGATVKKGQAIFDIETDKAAMEIEAPADGVIKLGGAKKGDVIAIGAVVAMIYAPGETPQAFAQGSAPSVTPALAATIISAVTPAQAGAQLGSKSEGIRATPLARRLARQKGVKLEAITGSGPRGRIVAEDVTQAKPAAAPSAAPALAAGPDPHAVRAMYAAGSFDVKPLDGMRRIIAQRLTQSKQTVPHFYLVATCTIDQLLAIRERLNARSPKEGASAYKLSINDFIIKAMALSLQQVPDANVTFTDDGILQHRASDLGVAVSVEGGLFTPIIRNAEKKALAAISSEMKELASRARAKKLQPAEYQGGSAAISNLGMFGVESFAAIINPPQATILAVGAAVERFVPVNRQPVLATQMSVTLSCDHRAVDGAVGAKLLRVFKSLIEDPALMLV